MDQISAVQLFAGAAAASGAVLCGIQGVMAMLANKPETSRQPEPFDAVKTLPEVIDAGMDMDMGFIGKPLHVVSVHIGHVKLLPKFAGQNFQISVQYGGGRDMVQCQTHAVHALKPPKPAAADFVGRVMAEYQRQAAVADLGVTCFFKASKHSAPLVKFSLVRPGKYPSMCRRRVFAECQISELSNVSQEKLQVKIFSNNKMHVRECCGYMDITLSLHSLPHILLKHFLRQKDAERQEEAFTACDAPTVTGVLDPQDEYKLGAVVLGEPLSPVVPGDPLGLGA